MALPTDVVDHILSFLQSDPISLKTCSKSHPILSKLAERHLYSSITIISGGSNNIVASENCLQERKLNRLSRNSDIANYVRSLKVNFAYKPSRRRRQATPNYLERVFAVVPQFLSLRKITINNARNDVNASWDIVANRACPAFLALFQSMEEVHIEGFNLNSSCLRRCQTVRFLTLSRCNFHSVDPSQLAPFSSPRPLLKSLSMDSCSRRSLLNILAWVQTLPLLSLRLLKLKDSAYDQLHSLLPQLLSGCSSSLNNLDLDFGSKVRTPYGFTMNDREDSHTSFPFINLLALPCLEGLTLHAEMDFHQVHPSKEPPEGVNIWIFKFFAPLPAMLQLVKSSPSLKRLCLDLRYYLWGHIRTASDLPCADDVWFLLLSLATECLSRSIKIYVCVRWDIQGGHSYPPDLISTSIADCRRLMQFVEQGVVVIKPRVWSGEGYEEEVVDGVPIGIV